MKGEHYNCIVQVDFKGKTERDLQLGDKLPSFVLRVTYAYIFVHILKFFFIVFIICSRN